MDQEKHPNAEFCDLSDIRAHLKSVKAPIDQDIRNYPTPIAGCDAQFNFLLEERAKISRELVHLEKLSNQPLSAAEKLLAIREFVRASDYLGKYAPKRRSLSSCL